MKRFIDLRGQHTGSRFAWWCTVRDCFDEYAANEAWSTWNEFKGDVETEHMSHLLTRYASLAPDWAFDPDPDDDFEADTVKEGEKMTDNEKTEGDQFYGFLITTDTGVYNVSARDSGIEVTQGGHLVFTSEGAGSNVQSHTLEAHTNPELKTIVGGMTIQEKELLVCMVVHYAMSYPVKDEMIAHKLEHKGLAERVSTPKAKTGQPPSYKFFYRATPLGKTIAQRLV